MTDVPKGFARKIAIALMPKWFNKRICSINGQWNEYYADAEQYMDEQWDNIIWPIIKDFDFTTVLELAPGAGRNTEKLAEVAEVIHAVDLNEYALDHLRSRFQDYDGACQLYFHRTSGNDLGMIESRSITHVYCWDSAVHFDKRIVSDYVKEFSRVLQPGGTGFVHHSNLGDSAQVELGQNPHARSNMTKELFRQYCEESGLQIASQTDLNWGTITDCISVFQKAK